MAYKYILTSEPRNGVLQVQLNRPRAFNALNTQIINELKDAIGQADRNPDHFGAAVITGDHNAFAAGADIKEMVGLTSQEVLKRNLLSNLDISEFGVPIIAAVEGFALGGGCELAMNADIIYASTSAQFGQPEILLGVLPAAGGTQRLIRAIGKSRAMEFILTGDTFSGEEAERWGLVSKVFEPGTVLENALDLAERLADGPRITAKACKKAVNTANETGLTNGLSVEKSLFYALFGNDEQKEGMGAFIAKRPPKFNSKL